MDERRSSRIRVLVADDADDFRLLLRATLELDGRFEVVGEAGDGPTVAALAGSARPDVIVLDVAMPGFRGVAAIPELRRLAPGAAVVVLSGYDADRTEEEALAYGALSYVEKGTGLGRIVDALLTAVVEDDQMPRPEPTAETAQPAATAGAGVATPVDVDDVLSYLTHELRNPIAVIAGLASTLSGAPARVDPEVLGTCIDAIGRNAQRLQELIDAIVDVRELDAGRFGVFPEPTDVGTFIDSASPDLAALAGARSISITADRVRGIAVDLDATRMLQALRHLVANAGLYGDGPIEVHASTTDDQLRISVQDHGAGVAQAHRGELFQPFSRLGSGSRGAGLGLYLTRGIACAHGGDATYESPASGGARFVITIPR